MGKAGGFVELILVILVGNLKREKRQMFSMFATFSEMHINTFYIPSIH